jgi:ribosome-binding factor A
MVKHRSSRLAESIKAEVSRIIREDIKDPRLGFVTVTDVEVTDDLRYARIFVSIMGNQEAIKTVWTSWTGLRVMSAAKSGKLSDSVMSRR